MVVLIGQYHQANQTFQGENPKNPQIGDEDFVAKCQVEYLFINPVTVVKVRDNYSNTKEELTQTTFAAQIALMKSQKTDNDPFYVMDVGCVNKLMEQWFRRLPTVKPYYSVNCNPDPVLLEILSCHPSIGFKCTSAENLNEALEIVPADRILYANPCLTRSALCHAAATHVSLIRIQSEGDLHRVVCCHPYADLIVNICVNPTSMDPKATLGCPLDEVPELLKVASLLGARCVGISFDVGSDCWCPEIYAEAIETSAQLFRYAISELGLIEMTILDIGGGFSLVSNNNCNRTVDDMGKLQQFEEVADQINFSLEHHFPTDKFPFLQVVATPGRFFAGSPYSLITSVIDKRPIDASTITNNDLHAGQEAFLYRINEGFFGSFGCKSMARCEPTCAPLFGDDRSDASNGPETVEEYGNVLGPLGFESDFDVVQTGVRFGRPLSVGDWLIWANMGAYSMRNAGTLNDGDLNEEASAPTSPRVFYFSTEEDWELLKSQNQSRRGSNASATTDDSGLNLFIQNQKQNREQDGSIISEDNGELSSAADEEEKKGSSSLSEIESDCDCDVFSSL